jgi:hypothetical protein
VELQAADGAALLGHPQDRAQQGAPAGRAGRLQPEAGEEDRGARHRGEGAGGTNAYLYLQSIEISTKKPPEARVELEQKLAGGNQARAAQAGQGRQPLRPFQRLDQYRGFVVSDINANTDTLSASPTACAVRAEKPRAT